MIEYRAQKLYADFYENQGRPLLVVVGGSRAGIPAIAKDLLEYFKNNYNLLVLAYFGVGDLSEKLERIPLEYFIHAVEFFKDKLSLTDDKVYMIGTSKGGELVLLLISEYLHPHTAIACVPSCYVWQGIPDNFGSILFPKSSWTFGGKEIPFVKFRYNRQIISDLKNKEYTSCHEKSIQLNKNKNVIIKVSNYQGNLLLLSAERDHYWPSKAMCQWMVQNGGKNIKHLTLDLEGHYFLQYPESGKEIMAFLNQQIG